MKAQSIGYTQLGVDLSGFREPLHTNPDLPYSALKPLSEEEGEAVLGRFHQVFMDLGQNLEILATERYIRVTTLSRDEHGQNIKAVGIQFGNAEPPPKGLYLPFEGDPEGTYRGVAMELNAKRAVVGVSWRDFEKNHFYRGSAAGSAREFLAEPLMLFPKLATAITHSRQTAAAASGRTLT